jgi:hypothetical protein
MIDIANRLNTHLSVVRHQVSPFSPPGSHVPCYKVPSRDLKRSGWLNGRQDISLPPQTQTNPRWQNGQVVITIEGGAIGSSGGSDNL